MTRLDKYLVEQELLDTRARAQDAIKEERVFVNDVMIAKNSYDVQTKDRVEVKPLTCEFVSRAGYKLYDVLEVFQLSLANRIVLDVGASTGGFSDVCLQAGAAYVYAVDVGSDQLAASLRSHPRLSNREHVNCRYLEKTMFDKEITFACMDVSFISITLILPAVLACMNTKELVVLVKPQFEAGRSALNKHGIVKDENIHVRVLEDMKKFIDSLHVYVHHVCASSITGRDGNKEFVFHIKDTPSNAVFNFREIVKNYQVKR